MLIFCNYLEAHIMMYDIKLIRVFLSCYKRILLSHQIIVSSRTQTTLLFFHTPSPPSIYFSKKAEKAVGTPHRKIFSTRKEKWVWAQQVHYKRTRRKGRKEENTGDEKELSTFLWSFTTSSLFFFTPFWVVCFF